MALLGTWWRLKEKVKVLRIVDQEVPSSRLGGGTITFNGLADLQREVFH